MRKLLVVLLVLLFSVTAFAQGSQQAEEKYIVHVGYQFGKYTPDSTGLAAALTYLATVATDSTPGIVWMDFPVDTVGQGAISNIHVMGWVVNSTDTNWVTSAGQADVAGALSVSGASTLTGNVSVGGTLGVTGATTLSSTLGAGNTTVTGTLAVTGNSTFGGTLQGGTFNFATASMVTGTADSIDIDFTSDLPTASAGLAIMFVAEAANTGATTIVIDGGTETAVVEGSDGSALEAGDIASGMLVHLVYDGTSWVQISQSGN